MSSVGVFVHIKAGEKPHAAVRDNAVVIRLDLEDRNGGGDVTLVLGRTTLTDAGVDDYLEEFQRQLGLVRAGLQLSAVGLP